jgi:hypothetical protein
VAPDLKREKPVFDSSHQFDFFDYFRVPYTVRPELAPAAAAHAPLPVHRLVAAEPSGGKPRSLFWPATATDAAPSGRYQLRDFTFFGHVAGGSAVTSTLGQLGHGWHPIEPITGGSADGGRGDGGGGDRAASVWQDAEGSVFLPFDPGEVMQIFWSEAYRQIGRSAMARHGRAAMLRGYYLLRPALPRRLQLRLRRGYTRVQDRSAFPSWPVEDSCHTFYAWLFGLLAGLAGQPVPFVGLWPDGRSWTLVLTHDVETDAGCNSLDLLRGPERELGYRSSWNFVPLRYSVAEDTLRGLREEGCEIGVHGLRHDGRDLGSRRLLARRLPGIREHAERWEAVGFRSPATQRHWELMPMLGFDYDTSYTDTDPYEPQPGGCCTYLPYFNQDLVELPITLPQDHTVFEILRSPDAELWLRKVEFLRAHDGMALVLTHPDYAHDPRLAQGYRTLLERYRDDSTVWQALPREVAAWWRDRAHSQLRRSADGWRLEGPAAARGRVEMASGVPALRAG